MVLEWLQHRLGCEVQLFSYIQACQASCVCSFISAILLLADLMQEPMPPLQECSRYIGAPLVQPNGCINSGLV